MHWYVNVENQAYGPYSDEQMRGFVAEGRVTAASLISNAPENGFYGAAEFDAFNLWSGTVQQNPLQPLVAVGDQMGAVSAMQVNQQYAPIQQVAQAAQAIQATSATQLAEPYYQAAPTQMPQSDTARRTISGAASNVFLIMAEIRSSGEMAFLQTMQNFGQAERIGDTVWLVRTSNTVEQIRNILSQTLDQQDRLFILDSNTGKTAWFNIGADLDHRIRELWDETEK